MTNTTAETKLLTIEDVAELTGFSVRRLRLYVQYDGKDAEKKLVPHTQKANKHFFHPEEVKRWMQVEKGGGLPKNPPDVEIPDRDFYNITQAAAYLGISERGLRYHVSKGNIEADNFTPGTLLFWRDELDRWKAKQA